MIELENSSTPVATADAAPVEDETEVSEYGFVALCETCGAKSIDGLDMALVRCWWEDHVTRRCPGRRAEEAQGRLF
jgi:hypothetical protein